MACRCLCHLFVGDMNLNQRFFERRRVRFVVSAELSKHFSADFGLDSKTFQSHDLSQLPWIGPLPGDITEVEAFCRIFRAAERLHNVLMHTLCNPLTGECSVSYNFPSEDKPLLEDKNSVCSRLHDINVRDDKLPPLAIFRGEMKRYCESLHVALENYLTPDDNRSLSVTEEGLKWLMEKGFKTIVDLRAETVQDNFYETVLDDAIFSGKVELVKLPVEVGTAPSSEQVEKFAALMEAIYGTTCITIGLQSCNTQRDKMEELSTSKLEEGASFGDGNGLLPEQLGTTHETTGKVLNHTSLGTDNKDVSCNGAYSGFVSHQDTMSLQSVNNGELRSLSDFNSKINPLKSQLPPCNVFSRKEMSSEIIGTSPELRLMETGSTNGSASSKTLALKSQSPPVSKGTYLGDNGYPSSGPNPNGFAKGERYPVTAVADPLNVGNELYKNVISITDDQKPTGVVRIQSRRKAEMFLVRTDGFSCSREKVTESSLAFTHPSTQQQMLMWKSTPKTVLLLKKLGQELMEEAKEVASFLYHQEKMNVLVEPDVHDIFARIPGFGFVQTFYSQDTSDLHERVDFVACLGGDGVILHASNLFRGAVPPVVSFNLGSLGFLTSHNFEDFRQDFKAKQCRGKYLMSSMRLWLIVVLIRGSNPYISKIECYEHDRLITKVQGDGVIVGTPTGSTAYSTAAGGSMVHPNVPCMLFTPICPHSLSFRPVILPDSARLELKIPEDARSNAWVSFDGKRRQQLSRGDSVRISMSEHPLPTVNKSDQTGDWFRSLIRCLNWNERLDQKAL
ncbi:NAD kinase 2 [Actinidia rufa]|uniref:NAD(+) kinase n=1 Tax=Actinidia rufa TaxID=165716 RepID=A0A7J0DLE5_9ERIC|nr:NAD kinase 2 [Actinidia rufa]